VKCIETRPLVYLVKDDHGEILEGTCYAKEIQKDLSEGKVDKENINIDINQTKNFIEGLGSKIEGFLAELEKSVEDIHKK